MQFKMNVLGAADNVGSFKEASPVTRPREGFVGEVSLKLSIKKIGEI